MTSRHLMHAATSAIMAATLLFCGPRAISQQPSGRPPPPPPPAGAEAEANTQAQEGIEVLARGPVHEAFAEPLVFKPEEGLIAPNKPPEPIEELPSEQRPSGDSVWIPGYWSWDEEREDFTWVSGFWRMIPPGREWVPGYWVEVEGGWRWVSGYWAAAGGEEIAYLPEPPDSLEAGPSTEPPSAEHAWAPGCWYWRESRYVWRPGYWYVASPNWIWCPPHYCWTPRGYVFIDGYWDFVVLHRGLLFSPVHFDAAIYARRGFRFSPHVVVNLALLTDHLFVRPRHCHYYFGDYYAQNYVSVGIYPWFAFHYSDFGYDPIFVHHHHHHHHVLRERNWEADLRARFVERSRNEEERPARVFVAAEERPERERETALVKTLAEVSRSEEMPIRLEQLDENRREAIARQAERAREFVQERQKLESEAETRPPREGQPPPRVRRPKSPIVAPQPLPGIERPGQPSRPGAGERPEQPTIPRPGAGERPTPPPPGAGERPEVPRPGAGERPRPTPRPGAGEQPERPRPTPPRPGAGERPEVPRPGAGERPRPTPPTPRPGAGEPPERPRPTPPPRPGAGERPEVPRPGAGEQPERPRPTPPRPGAGKRPEEPPKPERRPEAKPPERPEPPKAGPPKPDKDKDKKDKAASYPRPRPEPRPEIKEGPSLARPVSPALRR
jgi:hypothetical protein